MTDSRTPRPARRSREAARTFGPAIVLAPSPVYLRDLPLWALLDLSPKPSDPMGAAARIERALRARGIYARPTLAEVEAERGRRGLRRGLVIADVPADAPRPARVVHPMIAPLRTAEEARAEARANRDRIASAFAGMHLQGREHRDEVEAA